MSSDSWNSLEELLRRLIGLDVASVGRGMIERAVAVRRSAVHAGSLDEYIDIAQRDSAEQQALVETVVVPETWFFRDREAFEALAHFVAHSWLPRHLTGTLRVLIAPCSTGEEAYSVVMTLAGIGFPLQRLTVDALDISVRVLEIARHGVYGNNSFRGRSLEFRDRFFRPLARGFEINEAVREPVTFRYGNLTDPLFNLASSCSADPGGTQAGGAAQGMITPGGYAAGPGTAAGRGTPTRECLDVIFCRNVLIYFERETQRDVVKRLVTCLSPGGLLFVGSAETFLARDAGLEVLDHPMAFGYRKPSHTSSTTKKKKESADASFTVKRAANPGAKPTHSAPHRTNGAKQPEHGKKHAHPAKPPAPAVKNKQPSASAPPPKAPPKDILNEARALADSNRLADASRLIEDYIKSNPADSSSNVEGYYLLAVVRDAQGEEERAAELYRKTLYLRPDHSEALAHLAIIAERRGDRAGAARLRERARRAEEKAAK